MSETATKEDPPAIVPIESLDQFVGILTRWHAHKVKVLEHMLSVPEGTEMQVDGGEPVPLTGDMMAGFRAGLSLALMELGNLPFVTATRSDAPAVH